MTRNSKTRTNLAVVGLCALALSTFAGRLLAADERDDRNLLRPSSGDPYVFIIFDSSGSMHWTPSCTEADACTDIDPYDSQCTAECPFGDPEDVNNALCQRICPSWGCLEYAFAEPPIFEEIIIDNADSSGVMFTGGWNTGNQGVPWQGNYRHDNNSGKGNKTARFTPQIDIAASYQVYLWWGSDALGRRATNVPVDITHAGGTTTVTVNQRAGGDAWFLLGEFDFDAGTSGDVLIRTTGTDQTVIADAVRFLATRKPDPPPPCKKFGYRCQQPQCPTGDCFASLNADDPTSKFFQAKQALYEVLDQVGSIRVGFATFEQDSLRTKVKHWVYRVAATKPNGDPQDQLQIPLGDTNGDGNPDYLAFPPIGTEDVFGTSEDFNANTTEGWRCSDGGWTGCRLRPGFELRDFDPADIGDTWEMERIRRYPKLGRSRSFNSYVVVRANNSNSQIYRIRYAPVGSTAYGATTQAVEFQLRRCANPSLYSSSTQIDVCQGSISPQIGSTVTVYYDLVSDFLAWDDGTAGRNPPQVGYFIQASTDLSASNTCDGWDPNTDTGAAPGGTEDDLFRSYSLRWPTTGDPLGASYTPATALFDIGDVIPLDWRDSADVGYVDRISAIQGRLAPNTVTNPAADPDFRNAIYFNDNVLSGDDPTNNSRRKLRLRDDRNRPILGFGSTPLGGSMFNFQEWFAAWSGLAATGGDVNWACRKKYLLVLTDGDESCHPGSNDNDPCDVARVLNQTHNVQTFVVGFGLAGGSSLECMAEEGGTGEPIYPRNKDELVDALTNIFGQILVESRTFASASIPAVQSAAADKIYLSSFTPVDKNEPIWPGEVNVFRKPLPLNDNNEPDTSRKCVDSGQERDSGCHLYEIGEQLVEQAPTQSDLDADPTNLKIGLTPGDSTRRVFYGKSNPRLPIPDDPSDPIPALTAKLQPNPLRLFDLPTTYKDAVDLGEMLAPPGFTPSDPSNEAQSIKEYGDAILPVLQQMLKVKERTVLDASGGREDFEWVLGDIFHANPLVISTPNDFTYFAADLCGADQSEASPPSNCTPSAAFGGNPELIYQRGYRQYVRRNVWRRRMLFVATNDGQLHAFDAGTHRVERTAGGDLIDVFDDGTGKELFSYMPRLVMPIVRVQGTDRDIADEDVTGPHIFSLDTSLALRDVFIDPAPSTRRAPVSASHAIDDVITPVPADREWRTVVVGGMREGGDVFDENDDTLVAGVISGYYALDVTEPDIIVHGQRDDPPRDKFFNEPPASPAEPFSGQRVDPVYPDPRDGSPPLVPSCLDADTTTQDQKIKEERCKTLSREDVPFPAELWTFNDTFYYETSNATLAGTWSFDEEVDDNVGVFDRHACPVDITTDGRPDGNCFPDLGETWSRPVVGQVRVCVSATPGTAATKCSPTFDAADPTSNDEVTTRHVAIFGGGMDPQQENKYSSDGAKSGNWLYMVDVETGKVIYKRALIPPASSVIPVGSTPSDPAALDIDRDGILDVVYIGTTAGYLYKVDLAALTSTGQVPALETRTHKAHEILVRPIGGVANRFPVPNAALGIPEVDIDVERVFAPEWEPFPIIDAGGDIDTRRQIFFAPTAFFIRERNQYALAFGTGDRDDLWDRRDDVGGRFFTFVDENFTRAEFLAGDLPLSETDYAAIGFEAALASRDYLRSPESGFHPGWVMSFTGGNYRTTSQAFVVSGILIFSVYDPDVVPAASGDQLCAYSGESLSFVVYAETADPVAPLSDPDKTSPLEGRDRYRRIGDFTTAPFIDRTASKNIDKDGTGKDITKVQVELQNKLREAIKSRYPRGSRFNDAYNILIGAFESSTGAQVYATIPVAIFPSDWREE
ncbi:MAG: hypothetical protein HC897_00395 [Thermoanaerobaculia bacterium]|nr:hypothetical protein [Thermoanaerobaculia bacterium]